MSKSPIELLQEAMKEAMKEAMAEPPLQTGGPPNDMPKEDVGFVNLFEDDLFPKAKVACSCEITGQGRIPNTSCQLTEKEHYG